MITKKDLSKSIATKQGISQKEATAIINQLVEEIQTNVEDGESVRIQGLCTFNVSHRKARVSRNPRTGDPINVPAKDVVSVKVSKSFNDRLN